MIVTNNGFFAVNPQDVAKAMQVSLESAFLLPEDKLACLEYGVKVLNCKHSKVLLKIGEETAVVEEEQCILCGWTQVCEEL